MSGKTYLKLHHVRAARDEISVVHSELGTPLPFEWISHDTIAVDDCFADVASIKITPIPQSQRNVP